MSGAFSSATHDHCCRCRSVTAPTLLEIQHRVGDLPHNAGSRVRWRAGDWQIERAVCGRTVTGSAARGIVSRDSGLAR